MEPRAASAVTWRVALTLLGIGCAAYVLWKGASFVRLALFALVLAAALQTVVSALEHRRWRRGLAVAATCAGVLTVLLLVAFLLVPRVAPQLEQAAEGAPGMVSDLQDSPQYRWLREHQVLERGISQARKNIGTAVGSLLSAAVEILSFGAALVTVAGLTAFLLVSGPASWRWILRWVPPPRRARVRGLGAKVRSAVAGYVAGALAIGAVAGLVTGITTGLLGVPYFLALAVITAALGIVPFIGAIVSGIIVVLTTFLTSGATAGAVAFLVFVAYQQLEGFVLQPLVQRRTISMNPLVVVVAVLLGTSAGGISGGVLALPITAAAQVVANDVLARRRRGWRTRRDDTTRAEPPFAPSQH